MIIKLFGNVARKKRLSRPPRVALPPSLPLEIRSALKDFARAGARWGAGGIVSRGVLTCVSVVVIACALDRFADIAGAWRLPFTALAGALAVAFVGAALWRLLRPEDYDRVAWQLDRARGDSRDRLRSSVDFARRGLAENPFAKHSINETSDAWKEKNASGYAQKRQAIRLALIAAAVTAAVAVAAFFPESRARLLWRRFLDPLGNHMRPSATWFEVQPSPPDPLHGGDNHTVRAMLRGTRIENPMPMARIKYADGAFVTRKLVSDGADGWQLLLADLRQDIEFVLTMDRARSERHVLRVLPRPTVTRIEVTYDYPRYTNMKRRTETLAGRSISALEGTKIRIDIFCNMPLQKAFGSVGDDLHRFAIDLKEPERAACYMFMTADGAMDLNLAGQNGLEGRGEPPLFFRVARDTPPTVTLDASIEDREYYLTEQMDFAYRAQDDYGIMELTLQSGSFVQDAEMESYGAREAAGFMRIPIASVAKPGDRSVSLRMLARDGKGRATLSREIVIRIAANTYDRQMRLARNILFGTMDARYPTTCGFPMIARNRGRLESLQFIKTRVGALVEALAENAKPGKAEEPIVADINERLGKLSPEFYLLYQTGYGAVFDWVAAMPFLPRFQRLARNAMGAELALNDRALRSTLSAALSAENPKSELGKVALSIDAAIAVQEDVVRRLNVMSRMISVELAGFLADKLLAEMNFSESARSMTQDDLLNAQTALRECVSIAAGQSIPAATNAALKEALAMDDPAASLEAVRPALVELADGLFMAADSILLNESSWIMPMDKFAAANRPLSGAWLDCYMLFALVQANGRGADEFELLNIVSRYHQWREKPDSDYRPIGSPDPLVRTRHDAAVRLGFTLGAMRADMQALRAGLAVGYLSPGQPEFESLWIGLRERHYELLNLRDHPSFDAAIRSEVAGLTERMDAFRRWMPRETDPSLFCDTLAEWEAAAGALSVRLTPAVNEALGAMESDLAERRDLLPGAVASYRREIGLRIKKLEKGSSIFSPMWSMRARLFMLQLAVRQIASAGEAARIYQSGPRLDLEQLTMASLFINHALVYFHGTVLPMDDSILLLITVTGGDRSGKIKEYQELDHRLDGASYVFGASLTPESADLKAAEYNLSPALARERTALRSSLDAEASLTNKAGVLRAVMSDNATAPAVWGKVGCDLRDLGKLLRSTDSITEVGKRARQLAQWTDLIGALPRAVNSLPDTLADAARDGDSPGWTTRMANETDELIMNIRELARPMPGAGVADKLGVGRALVEISSEDDGSNRAQLRYALSAMAWNRRKTRFSEGRVGVGGFALNVGDEFENLKLPKHLYLELKRAREQAMPELFMDRSYRYLNKILEQAR